MQIMEIISGCQDGRLTEVQAAKEILALIDAETDRCAKAICAWCADGNEPTATDLGTYHSHNHRDYPCSAEKIYL